MKCRVFPIELTWLFLGADALPPAADTSKTKTEKFCSESTFLWFSSILRRYFIYTIRSKMFPDNKCCHFVIVESLFQSWFLRFSCNFGPILRCDDLFCTHFDVWGAGISLKSADLSFPDHVDEVLKKSEGKIPSHHGENRFAFFFVKKKQTCQQLAGEL